MWSNRLAQLVLVVLVVLIAVAFVVENGASSVDTSVSGKYAVTPVTPAPAVQYRETVYRYFTVIEERSPYNTNDYGFLLVVEIKVDSVAYPSVQCDFVVPDDNGHNCEITNAAGLADFLTTNGLETFYSVFGG